MKILTKPTKWLAFVTVAGITTISWLLPQASQAQTGDVNPLQDFQTEENSDPFSSSNQGDAFGIFDLIHRAQLGNVQSIEEYSTQQNQNLDAAAAQFREMQKKRIQGESTATPTVTDPTSEQP